MHVSEIYEDIVPFTPRKFSDAALRQYLETALWSATDHDEQPLDANYSIEDFAPEAVSQARLDLNRFLNMAKDLVDGEDETTVAHDFWLTRNGHGAGFWDGDYEHEKGQALTKISKQFKEITPYVGDNGKIYFG